MPRERHAADFARRNSHMLRAEYISPRDFELGPASPGLHDSALGTCLARERDAYALTPSPYRSYLIELFVSIPEH
jgi:hypothetical protein